MTNLMHWRMQVWLCLCDVFAWCKCMCLGICAKKGIDEVTILNLRGVGGANVAADTYDCIADIVCQSNGQSNPSFAFALNCVETGVCRS